MASVYQLKPAFQELLRPLVRNLASWGATANMVTVGAAALSVAFGGLMLLTSGAKAVLLALPIFLFFRMTLNAVDGILAREHGQKSRTGFILNELGDVVSDAALYLPFTVLLGPLWAVPVVLFVISEMSGVLPLAFGGERRYDGPMGKSDRAVVYGVLAVALVTTGVSSFLAAVLALAVSSLSIVTTVRRARGAIDA